MILIGSTAIKYWFPDFPREPKDVDYAVKDKGILKSDRETEFLLNPVFCDFVGYRNMYRNTGNVPTADEIYTLKMSHLFWDVNWDKHFFDVRWLKDRGCVLIRPLFDELYQFWNKYHGTNKRSKLDMTAEDFFDNAVKCPYEHDWLHTLLQNPPTYTKVLKDGAEVDVSEEKFDNLSEEEKASLVKEEVMVMSYERKFHKDYRHSYGRMLKKFIINHAPMWEALWIIENFKLVYKPDFDYFNYLNNKINEHTSHFN